MSRDNNNAASNLVFFLIGAAVGASVALLYAPQEGEETRRFLGDRASDARDKATELAGTARDKATDLAGTARGKASELTGRATDTASTLAQQPKTNSVRWRTP